MKRRQHGLRARFFMAGNEGFEPPMPDSESGALPLGEFPKDVLFQARKDICSGFLDTWATSLGEFPIQNSGIVSKGGIFANLFLTLDICRCRVYNIAFDALLESFREFFPETVSKIRK